MLCIEDLSQQTGGSVAENKLKEMQDILLDFVHKFIWSCRTFFGNCFKGINKEMKIQTVC